MKRILFALLLVATFSVQAIAGGYCARNDGQGWRAVNGPEDVGYDETYSATQPVPSAWQVKESKWDAIKAERERRTQTGGYLVAGKWFNSDQISRTQQIALAMSGGNIPAGLQWKTMDGSFITMTATLAQQVFSAAMASDAAIYAYAETLKARMEASADPANFGILTGWPLIYGE